MPVAVHVVHEAPADWRGMLFDGAVLVVSGVTAVEPFVEHARRLLAEAFAPAAAENAQSQLGDDDFLARADRLRAAIRRDARARELAWSVLAAFGLEAATTYTDRLHLRVLPAGASPQHAVDLALGAHRDTWSSNVYAQVNWWLPLHHVTDTRALAFYPRNWTTAVPNSSAAWDLELLRRERVAGGPTTVPLVPAPLSPPDPADALVVVVQPGDLLLFSGAHLHATVPNTSGTPRYSVELRTVDLDDVRTGRGAPNVDGDAPCVPVEWFRNVEDGSPLTDAAGGHAGPPV